MTTIHKVVPALGLSDSYKAMKQILTRPTVICFSRSGGTFRATDSTGTEHDCTGLLVPRKSTPQTCVDKKINRHHLFDFIDVFIIKNDGVPKGI